MMRHWPGALPFRGLGSASSGSDFPLQRPLSYNAPVFRTPRRRRRKRREAGIRPAREATPRHGREGVEADNWYPGSSLAASTAE